jgi:hypothetical protein
MDIYLKDERFTPSEEKPEYRMDTYGISKLAISRIIVIIPNVLSGQ